MMHTNMVNWPAIIHYSGDDELTYLASDLEWRRHNELSTMDYAADDVLIDSVGRVYRLDTVQAGNINPPGTGRAVSVNELTMLVRKYAALGNTCCSDRIGFRNLSEGMAIVASLAKE